MAPSATPFKLVPTGRVTEVAWCSLRVKERKEHKVQWSIFKSVGDDSTNAVVPTSHIDPAEVEQIVIGGDPIGPVVVAGDHGYHDLNITQSPDGFPKQLDRFGGGDRSVEDIASDHYEIDAFILGDGHNMVAKGFLIGAKRNRPKGTTEVPVAGV